MLGDGDDDDSMLQVQAQLLFTSVRHCIQNGKYLDILLLQQGTPGSSATLSPTSLLVTPAPTSMMSLYSDLL